ncbi:glycosyltransferase family 2 protein [Microbacterium sp. VKM Ac-2923]|uniref:glycosyltransferase n=1 Tax=Microbacterium sp. VKM Ac-2923 TaxID=2929476 RepID=UPI001FB43108|nr:glycosyltransferase family 2 protein [Microbacterium sp. VKM Ac-2923]MCJ1706785.1 glycosyltransferase family 2 protein [Microbacterium sp. VKM Ac-2923]
MTVLPSVSIVVPAFNEEAVIAQCLDAVIHQTVPAVEVLVVDNRSTDATRAVVEGFIARHPDAGIRLLRQDDRQGLVPTRNLGMDAAIGDVLGRIDADTALKPDWVAQVSRVFASGEIDAASGPVEYYDLPLRAIGQQVDDAFRRLQVRLAGDFVFLFGSNMAVRADAWRDVREFLCDDEDDVMHEDLDIAVHLALGGRRIAYSSHMVAAIGARRLDDRPRDFRRYIDRFENTYAAHDIRDVRLRAPMAVFLGVYPALHMHRRVQAQLRALRS